MKKPLWVAFVVAVCVGLVSTAWATQISYTVKQIESLPGPSGQPLLLGGTGLNEILRSRNIKNIAVAGFTTDVCVYATVTNGYDLGYHVYALKDAMVGYFPEQSELMLKNTYPMWSKVLSNDEWLNMLSAGAKISTR